MSPAELAVVVQRIRDRTRACTEAEAARRQTQHAAAAADRRHSETRQQLTAAWQELFGAVVAELPEELRGSAPRCEEIIPSRIV